MKRFSMDYDKESKLGFSIYPAPQVGILTGNCNEISSFLLLEIV
jgi:Tubulin